MADWVLILLLSIPSGTALPPAVQVNPIYFRDKAACEAAISVLEQSNANVKIGGKCVPTKSEL